MKTLYFSVAVLLLYALRPFSNAYVPSRIAGSAIYVGSAQALFSTNTVPDVVQADQSTTLQEPSHWELSLDENRRIAKNTWETIALSDVPERDQEVIDMRSNSKVYDTEAFERFISQVKGTYFVNGLGSCKVGNRLVHPFEAPGFIKSLAFKGDGRIVYTRSLVQTRLTKWERRLNTMLAKGVMSSVAPFDFGGALLNAVAPGERNTANIAATLWPPTRKEGSNPILIVGGDMSHPYIVDPETLETLGPLDRVMDGVGDIKDVLAGRKLLAHTRIDEDWQRLIMCSSTLKVPGQGRGGGNTVVEFFEFDTNFNLVSSREYTTDFIMFHDWMITKDYYVVPKNPAKFDLLGANKYLAGFARGTESFQMDEDTPGSFLLIPREPCNNDVVEAESDRFFNIFHFGPCYQDEDDETMVVYGAAFDQYKFGGEMGFETDTQKFDPIAWSSSSAAPAPRLDKYVISVVQQAVIRRERFKLSDDVGSDIPVDMPVFREDGSKMRYSYFSGATRPEGWFPFRSIVKVDLETGNVENWDAGNEKLVSEATFIPTEEEEDVGFVFSIEHDAGDKSCSLVVWDAAKFGKGPICAVDLGSLMPWCVHGSWTSYISD